MPNVPFYPNAADRNQCMVSCYRMLIEYFAGTKMSQAEVRNFVGYKDKRAAWTLMPLTKLAQQGFGIRVIEPFDYRRYATEGIAYLRELYDTDKAKWYEAHTNILSIKPYIADFLQTVHWENRQASLQDIDAMLADGYLVFVTLNSNKLNGKTGYIDHAVLIIESRGDEYIVHDPGPEPQPYRRIPRQLLWQAMGAEKHTSEVTGIKKKSNSTP